MDHRTHESHLFGQQCLSLLISVAWLVPFVGQSALGAFLQTPATTPDGSPSPSAVSGSSLFQSLWVPALIIGVIVILAGFVLTRRTVRLAIGNIRVGIRLALSNFLVVAIGGSMVLWLLTSSNTMMQQIADRSNIDEKLSLTLSAILSNGLQTGQATRNVIMNPSDELAKKNFAAAENEIQADLKEARSLAAQSHASAIEIQSIDQLTTESGQDLALQREIQGMAIQGHQKNAIEALNTRETPLWRLVKKGVIALRDKQLETMNANLHSMQAKVNFQTHLAPLLGFGALFLVIVTVWLFTRTITVPLSELKERALRLAHGEVDTSAVADRKDEIGELQKAFDELVAGTTVQVEAMKHLADGDLNVSVSKRSDGDILNKSIQHVIEVLRALRDEANALTEAAVAGRLAVRGDAAQFHGGFRQIVQGVNNTLDAVIGPLNIAAEYVNRISKGDLPPAIKEEYQGDFNEIRRNLNQCIANLSGIIAEMQHMSSEHDKGNIDVVIPSEKFTGAYRAMTDGVNAMVGGHIAVTQKAMACMAGFAGGDYDVPLERFPGKKAFINENIELLRSNVKGFIREMEHMSEEHRKGDIDVRIPMDSFHGAYRAMVEGVNGMVGDHIAVNMKAMACVAEFGHGNFDAPLEQFPGKKALINDTIEDVRRNLKEFESELGTLVSAASEGQLSTRADHHRFVGGWQKLTLGVNSLLDNVIAPVTDGAGVLAEMAKGDLTARVTAGYKGDHRLITDSINQVAENLESALNEVREAASATASASGEISASTEEMAAGAQEQTRQTSEVAAAVEEMTKTILANSRNAQETANVAKSAKDAANAGGDVVARTVEGMKKIAEVVDQSARTVHELGRSSDQIGEIVTVIDDIADQTNLLALNAAIEAARAGDQGRGFAVVADEVRKLAERTTKATKEIAQMIKKIQNDTAGAVTSMQKGTMQVSEGITLADKAGASLHNIVQVSQQVTDMVTQIASASEEQSSAAEQISRNIGSISAVTSQTASGTHQVARAAEDLNRLTARVQELITKFTLTGNRKSPSAKGRDAISVERNGVLV